MGMLQINRADFLIMREVVRKVTELAGREKPECPEDVTQQAQMEAISKKLSELKEGELCPISNDEADLIQAIYMLHTELMIEAMNERFGDPLLERCMATYLDHMERLGFARVAIVKVPLSKETPS